MKPVNQKASRILSKLIALADESPTRHVRIANNDTFMAVIVERIFENRVSVAHYGEQNGDLMADPEMEFYIGADGRFYPCTFRNDYTAYYRKSIEFSDGKPLGVYRREQADQASFAGTWMENIRQQQNL